MTCESADWEVLAVPGVTQAIERAARRVGKSYDFLDAEDLAQEAALAFATRPRHARGAVEGGVAKLGIVNHRAMRLMTDKVKTGRRRSARFGLVSLSKPESTDEEPVVALGGDLALECDYSPKLVRELLAAMVAGAEICWGGASWSDGELRARRTSVTYTMAVADVRRAWSNAGLTMQQRRALLLEALGFTQAEAAQLMGGRGQSTVNEHIKKGALRLADYLNGDSPTSPGVALRAG
jgi:DNA-directed RNA polymerase specialized sigma24 family protein